MLPYLLLFQQLQFNFGEKLNQFPTYLFQKKNNKQMKCVVPLDKYKFNILSDKAFKEALFVVVFIYYLHLSLQYVSTI